MLIVLLKCSFSPQVISPCSLQEEHFSDALSSTGSALTFIMLGFRPIESGSALGICGRAFSVNVSGPSRPLFLQGRGSITFGQKYEEEISRKISPDCLKPDTIITIAGYRLKKLPMFQRNHLRNWCVWTFFFSRRTTLKK